MEHDKVGIVGYGVYIPWQRIETEKIIRERERERKRGRHLREFIDKVKHGLLLRYKSVAGSTEDTITMSAEAAENAMIMAGIDPTEIQCVIAGSESKPYAVGTIARHVASFLGMGERVYVADIEGACNAGMQGMSFIESEIKSGKIEYGLAIGADIAQAPRGDPLEYACGCGAAAFVLGKKDLVATIEDVVPYSSLTMDFWRRDGSPVPKHFGKTTVDAYVSHVTGAIGEFLRRHQDLSLKDFDYITFHQPSGYMPLKACKALMQPSILIDKSVEDRARLSQEDIEVKIKPWLNVLDIGNTYAASTPIGVSSILDQAKPKEMILAVSYGSGAYSLATWFTVQEGIESKRKLVPKVDDYIRRGRFIMLKDYTDHIKERLSVVKKRLVFPRIIGDIEPIGSESYEISMCDGCERIYYPARDRCLDPECKGNMERKKLPKTARLKCYKKLPLKKRLISNLEIMQKGKVLLVDCVTKDLKKDMEVEAIIRRIDYEGGDGLIIYGPCYRPLFRSQYMMQPNTLHQA